MCVYVFLLVQPEQHEEIKPSSGSHLGTMTTAVQSNEQNAPIPQGLEGVPAADCREHWNHLCYSVLDRIALSAECAKQSCQLYCPYCNVTRLRNLQQSEDKHCIFIPLHLLYNNK